jgi:hypothetical protein
MFARLGASAGVAVILALGAAACQREPARCAICHMVIPGDTYTVVHYDGTAHQVCDPRCALTMQEQTRTRVRLDVVTDFQNGARFDPADAFFVTGSDTAPDSHTAAVRTWPGTTAHLHWHRCLPSVLAFRSRESAVAFQKGHGGRVVRLDDLGFEGHAAGPVAR